MGELRKAGKMDKFDKGIDAPEKKFSDLSNLNHASIRDYAMELLQHIAAQDDDALAVSFCERSPGEKRFFPEFDENEILFSNAYAYPGLTLVANDNPSGHLLQMASRLMEHMPTVGKLEEALEAEEARAQKEKKFESDDEAEKGDGGKAIALKFNPELVIQSEAFLKRWCPDRKAGHTERRMEPTVGEFRTIKELPVEEKWQMLALSGAAAFDPKLN